MTFFITSAAIDARLGLLHHLPDPRHHLVAALSALGSANPP
jgi:hypothetical protein